MALESNKSMAPPADHAHAAQPAVPYYKVALNVPPAPVSASAGAFAVPQHVPQLSRKFVARRISEGETGRLKEELKCQACGKGYKHVSSLAKHLWEHTPEWSVTSKLLISKHQQVQLLEAASILVSMNEEDEDEEDPVIRDSTAFPPTAEYQYSLMPTGPHMASSAPQHASAHLESGLFSGHYAPTVPAGSSSPLSAASSRTADRASASPLGDGPRAGSRPVLSSSPSPPPSANIPVPAIPMSSSKPISKSQHHGTSLSTSASLLSRSAHRSSSVSSAAYPPSSARGSTPGAGLASSPMSRGITDSLFTETALPSVKVSDEYEMLSTPYRARRLSHMRRSRADLFLDDSPRVPPRFVPVASNSTDDDYRSPPSSGDGDNDQDASVFGDMDD